FREDDVRGGVEIETDPGCGEGTHGDGDFRVARERVDRLLARAGRLLPADRDAPEPGVGEVRLGGVHHGDVFGEEDDLADGADQLHGVVRGERRLGLPDLADHRERVLTRLARLRRRQLAVGDDAHDPQTTVNPFSPDLVFFDDSSSRWATMRMSSRSLSVSTLRPWCSMSARYFWASRRPSSLSA